MRNQGEEGGAGVCFFIGPMGEPGTPERKRFETVAHTLVEPAARRAGLSFVSAASLHTPGEVFPQVIGHLQRAAVVVADLTDRNPNVYYELALCHASSRPVVALLEAGQQLPFNIHGTATIFYNLKNVELHWQAAEELERQVRTAVAPGFVAQSPVTLALDFEQVAHSDTPQKDLLESILTQVVQLQSVVRELGRAQPSPAGNGFSSSVVDKVELVLDRYADEIDLLKSIRYSGIIGVYKRREQAMQAFSPALDEEQREIVIVGSSLKGLLQKEEYKEVSEKLKFKLQKGLCRVRFLLTHPIVADLRASQENRAAAEIGHEIVQSLETLRAWGLPPEDVRLYLGTPTCFAIRTSRRMLINPYPYVSVSYDSPCLILGSAPDGSPDRPGYFFDEFKSRHFGAWDTDHAVQIRDFDEAIQHYRSMLDRYSNDVVRILEAGKAPIPVGAMAGTG